ncbi:MAG TPA: glycoside hydrolase family 32 protein [Candidatus Blautia faecipullorum]|nr:glycoside hydrolase family 32 protein [Candidatus Blautia faecipullorum]
MTSKLLQQAREFEREHIKDIRPEERPCYHVTGGHGWINDPNGFSYYKGEYHLFYQYHPYSNIWGPMHWGHVVSRDLITWERRPAIMAPDESYDDAGCFSGSALEMSDGRHLLMYTGVKRVIEPDGSERHYQTQCMATGDGTDYVKYEGNPVLTVKDVPEGGSPVDFRDPKIWQDTDGKFYAVAANATEDGNSAILLFESEDAFHWSFCNVLDRSSKKLGGMWECPDFFELDGRHILFVSPMEMMPEGLKYHAGHCTLCISGSYDKESRSFSREAVQPIDSGIDFYAPQTMLTPDGRRVMVAWMQSWSNTKFVPKGVKYFGQLTVPRELSFRDGKLIQKPVRELEAYRGERVCCRQTEISQETSLEGIRGRVMDMTIRLKVNGEFQEFCMKFACGEEYYTSVTYDPAEEVLCVDRSHSGYLYDIVHSRKLRVSPMNGEVTLRCLADRFSLEIFINDGSQTASVTLYTPLSADGITFAAKGKATIDIEKYNLSFS